jgi:hypothetical protein
MMMHGLTNFKNGRQLLLLAYEDGDSVYVISVRRVGAMLDANSGIPLRNYSNAREMSGSDFGVF